MKINGDDIQKKLESEQQPDEPKTLADGLFAALSLAVVELYRKYGPELNINRGSRKKTFFATISDIVTDHYKRVRQLVDSKARAGFASSYEAFMTACEKALDLPLIKSLPEKIVEEALKRGQAIGKTMTYNRRLTLKQLRKQFTQAFRRKETQDEAVKRVDDVVKRDRSRVERVVQEESARMQEEGKLQSVNDADSQGVGVEIRWISLKDDRVRNTHRRLHMQTADKEGFFYSNGNKGKGPHLFVGPTALRENINCRCYLSAVGVNVKDDKLWQELNSIPEASARRELWERRRALARERARGDVS